MGQANTSHLHNIIWISDAFKHALRLQVALRYSCPGPGLAPALSSESLEQNGAAPKIAAWPHPCAALRGHF